MRNTNLTRTILWVLAAAYAVALAESLLSAAPIMGRAAVQSYDRAKAYAPDDDEGKMIEIVSRPK